MITGPKLFGLVLAGGKSTRMGKDKGLIAYHGRPQRDHLYDLLDQVCEQAFVSVRGDQVGDLPEGFERIVDKDEFRGPYNGLLSAHRAHPGAAWLVLACDLPLLDLPSLKELVKARDPEVMATSFANVENPLPEPLCAIWEPRALEASIAYLQAGNGTCPRKFLINNEVKLVFPKNAHVLLNANSEEDYKEAMAKLSVS